MQMAYRTNSAYPLRMLKPYRGRRVARVAVAYEGRAIVPPPRALALAVTVRARSVSCCLAGRLWVLKFLLSRSGFPRSIEWVN